MRITQSMLSNNMLSNLTNSYEKMAQYQDQISSQKKITRPSDDPVVAMKGISYRRHLQEIEQYKRNFSEAYNWIENSDASLDKAGQALQRVRELMVQASNDTYDETQRESIRAEILQLKEHIVEIANTKVGDKYIFNGTNTRTKPFNPDGSLNGTFNEESVELELSQDVMITVNLSPNAAFTEDLFDKIDAIITGLDSASNPTGDSLNGFIEDVDNLLVSVTNARSSLGARMNRVELMEQRIDQQEIISRDVLSKNEDIDFEKVVTEMLAQESVHRAALSVSSRIIQPSLMDFLR